MASNEAPPNIKEKPLSPDEERKLISFFNVLIKIDHRLRKEKKVKRKNTSSEKGQYEI